MEGNRSVSDPVFDNAALRRTPLYDTHIKLGGRMVAYAGWNMPVQYAGIMEEHQAVRTHAGKFDVSHMGEIAVCGPDASEFLDRLLTNRIAGMLTGQAVYSPMCAEDGGTLDDLLVYRRGIDDFLLIVNAANRAADVSWIVQASSSAGGPAETRGMQVSVTDCSDAFGLIALQGPDAGNILAGVAGDAPGKLGYYRFLENVDVAGVPCLVSRTGYTGEDGFEIRMPSECSIEVWDALPAVPCGLGCRDTLRFEAGMPLYGNELARDISPLEAGLDRFVLLDKPGFIGRTALAASLAAGVPRRLVGFGMTGRGVARHGYPVWSMDGSCRIGTVTTGYHSPSLGMAVGTAMIESPFAGDPGLSIEIRGHLVSAVTRSRFFYKRKGKDAT